MVKFTVEPPRPLSPQKRRSIVRNARVFFFLLGMVLVGGGVFGGDGFREGARPVLVVLGALLGAVAVRASDATIDKMRRWLP